MPSEESNMRYNIRNIWKLSSFVSERRHIKGSSHLEINVNLIKLMVTQSYTTTRCVNGRFLYQFHVVLLAWYWSLFREGSLSFVESVFEDDEARCGTGLWLTGLWFHVSSYRVAWNKERGNYRVTWKMNKSRSFRYNKYFMLIMAKIYNYWVLRSSVTFSKTMNVLYC
jgi:hypothetical protein